jgi:hypothetical protein
MNKKIYTFNAEIKKVPDIDAAYIEFPYNIKKEFGSGRVKVCVTFDDEKYEGSIVNMGVKNTNGTICYAIGILKFIRQKIGKRLADEKLEKGYGSSVVKWLANDLQQEFPDTTVFRYVICVI